MKPMIILPPGNMSASDVKKLCDNGLCVVIAADPAAVKFVDPSPAAMNRSHIENVAVRLSRKILAPGFWSSESVRSDITRVFVDLLTQGTPLDPAPSQAEQEKRVFDTAKLDALRQLAREEAKAERLAAHRTASKT